uniref:Uncharacterized protein n=1 Tax=Corethron hystrix TaxID=216773 RepID=A0A7S1BL30_9STRA|mmetsp:Transcript_31403/g.71832  ORF Transcript_31403/g.71832 Transcript_31403/m.71832 type:complete len:794 (+) Transcript_31403:77-2458(+)
MVEEQLAPICLEGLAAVVRSLDLEERGDLALLSCLCLLRVCVSFLRCKTGGDDQDIGLESNGGGEDVSTLPPNANIDQEASATDADPGSNAGTGEDTFVDDDELMAIDIDALVRRSRLHHGAAPSANQEEEMTAPSPPHIFGDISNFLQQCLLASRPSVIYAIRAPSATTFSNTQYVISNGGRALCARHTASLCTILAEIRTLPAAATRLLEPLREALADPTEGPEGDLAQVCSARHTFLLQTCRLATDQSVVRDVLGNDAATLAEAAADALWDAKVLEPFAPARRGREEGAAAGRPNDPDRDAQGIGSTDGRGGSVEESCHVLLSRNIWSFCRHIGRIMTQRASETEDNVRHWGDIVVRHVAYFAEPDDARHTDNDASWRRTLNTLAAFPRPSLESECLKRFVLAHALTEALRPPGGTDPSVISRHVSALIPSALGSLRSLAESVGYFEGSVVHGDDRGRRRRHAEAQVAFRSFAEAAVPLFLRILGRVGSTSSGPLGTCASLLRDLVHLHGAAENDTAAQGHGKSAAGLSTALSKIYWDMNAAIFKSTVLTAMMHAIVAACLKYKNRDLMLHFALGLSGSDTADVRVMSQVHHHFERFYAALERSPAEVLDNSLRDFALRTGRDLGDGRTPSLSSPCVGAEGNSLRAAIRGHMVASEDHECPREVTALCCFRETLLRKYIVPRLLSATFSVEGKVFLLWVLEGMLRNGANAASSPENGPGSAEFRTALWNPDDVFHVLRAVRACLLEQMGFFPIYHTLVESADPRSRAPVDLCKRCRQHSCRPRRSSPDLS